MPFAPPNLLISLESLGSNPTLSASFKRLSLSSNQFAITLRGRASPTTFECACAISSVTTSP